jgi:hypothetical protein
MSFQKYGTTIQACLSCATHCENCASECLKEKNIENVTRCIELTKNCAAICLLTARFLSSGSEFIPQVCNLCIEICEVCAGECARNYMDSCAQYCQTCADECRMLTLEFV